MSTSLPLRLTLGLLALGLLVAGCGDDDEPSAGGTGWITVPSSTTTSSSTTSTEELTKPGGGLFDDHSLGAPGDGLFTTIDGDEVGSGGGQEAPGDVSDADVFAYFGSDLIDVELALALYDACRAGDMQACDTMWLDTPSESGAEGFAAACGGALPEADRFCIEVDSDATGSYVPRGAEFTGVPASDLEENLIAACGRGGMFACDALFEEAVRDGEAWSYGSTCGGRVETNLYCSAHFGVGFGRFEQWQAEVGL